VEPAPKTKSVRLRRCNVVVVASEVVPYQKDSRRGPKRRLFISAFNSVTLVSRLRTYSNPDAHFARTGDDPTHGRQLIGLNVGDEVRGVHDVVPVGSVPHVADRVES